MSAPSSRVSTYVSWELSNSSNSLSSSALMEFMASTLRNCTCRDDFRMYLVRIPFLVAHILNSAMMKGNNLGYCRDLDLVYCCIPAMTQIRRSGLWYRVIGIQIVQVHHNMKNKERNTHTDRDNYIK